MSSATYLGMNRSSGCALTDIEHIRQSVADILITPVGSRPMRRAYGSLLSELIDQPQNGALLLQLMAVCYSAISQWEPRISLSVITVESSYDGKMVVELTGQTMGHALDFSLSVLVS